MCRRKAPVLCSRERGVLVLGPRSDPVPAALAGAGPQKQSAPPLPSPPLSVHPDLVLGFRILSLALLCVTRSLIYTLGCLVPVTRPTNLSYVISSE